MFLPLLGLIASMSGYAWIGLAIGLVAGMMARDQTIDGNRIQDFQVTNSEVGRGIPVVRGRAKVSGNIIWHKGFEENTSRVKVQDGGWFGSSTYVNEYRYSNTIALAICKNNIRGVRRIWFDDKLFFSVNGKEVDDDFEDLTVLIDYNEETGMPNDPAYSPDLLVGELDPNMFYSYINRLNDHSGEFYRYKYTFSNYFNGEQKEKRSQAMIDALGEDNVPLYKDISYMIFTFNELEDFGNRIPRIHVEVIEEEKNEYEINASKVVQAMNITTQVSIIDNTGDKYNVIENTLGTYFGNARSSGTDSFYEDFIYRTYDGEEYSSNIIRYYKFGFSNIIGIGYANYHRSTYYTNNVNNITYNYFTNYKSYIDNNNNITIPLGRGEINVDTDSLNLNYIENENNFLHNIGNEYRFRYKKDPYIDQDEGWYDVKVEYADDGGSEGGVLTDIHTYHFIARYGHKIMKEDGYDVYFYQERNESLYNDGRHTINSVTSFEVENPTSSNNLNIKNYKLAFDFNGDMKILSNIGSSKIIGYLYGYNNSIYALTYIANHLRNKMVYYIYKIDVDKTSRRLTTRICTYKEFDRPFSILNPSADNFTIDRGFTRRSKDVSRGAFYDEDRNFLIDIMERSNRGPDNCWLIISNLSDKTSSYASLPYTYFNIDFKGITGYKDMYFKGLRIDKDEGIIFSSYFYERGNDEVVGTKNIYVDHDSAMESYDFYYPKNIYKIDFKIKDYYDTIKSSKVDLAQVVSDILIESGYSENDFDVSALEDERIIGYVYRDSDSPRSKIELLQSLYHFNLIEEDWKLVAKKRSDFNPIEIPFEELSYNNESGYRISTSIKSDTELNTKIGIKYSSLEGGYRDSSQYAEYPDTHKKEQMFDVPLVMMDDEAAQKADIMLTNEHREIEKYEFSLSMKYMFLNIGDIISIDGKLLRVVSIDVKEVSIDIIAISDSASSYFSTAIGDKIDDSVLGSIDFNISQRVVVWNGSPLDMELYNVNRPIIYVAGIPVDTNGLGSENGYVLGSPNGEDFDESDLMSVRSTSGGHIKTNYDDIKYGIDPVELKITFTNGFIPSSITKDTLFNNRDRNLIAIISNGEAEYIQYKDVEAVEGEDRTYIIKNILRGRYNSKPRPIKEDSLFVVIDRAMLGVRDFSKSRIGTITYTAFFKDFETLNENSMDIIDIEGLNIRPYGVVSVESFKENDIIDIRYKPVGNINRDWMGEDNGSIDYTFFIDLMDSNNEVIETIETNDYEVSYQDTSNQVSNFVIRTRDNFTNQFNKHEQYFNLESL